MTYWERILRSAQYFSEKQDYRIQRNRLVDPCSINKIEVWYYYGAERQGIEEILGGDECYDFLSAHSSFDEVQYTLNISGAVDKICCVNILDDFNVKHYGIEYPVNSYDMGTIEVFGKEGSSMLEKEIETLKNETL